MPVLKLSRRTVYVWNLLLMCAKLMLLYELKIAIRSTSQLIKVSSSRSWIFRSTRKLKGLVRSWNLLQVMAGLAGSALT